MSRIFSSVALIALLCTLVVPATIAAQSGGTDIAVRTIDYAGDPFYDACYELVGYSKKGCDDNRDGLVTFDDVTPGTYVLHQTENLSMGLFARDSEITVSTNPSSEPQIFTVRLEGTNDTVQQGEITPQESTDIALITREPNTGMLLTGVCYELIGYSKVGCDENRDGQVDFADIPFGDYSVRQTSAPNGYDRIRAFQIHVEVPDGIELPRLKFVVAQHAEQADRDHRNVSVVLYDDNTGKIVAGKDMCLTLEDATKKGCDNDLTDGQVDFVNVRTGETTVRFNSLVCPYEPLPRSGEYGFTIGGEYATQILFVPVVRGASPCQ